MRIHFLFLSIAALLPLVGCASTRTRPVQPEAERAAAVAAKARYWALQAAQKSAPVSSDFEWLPLTRPERTENGIIRNSSTDYIRVPRLP